MYECMFLSSHRSPTFELKYSHPSVQISSIVEIMFIFGLGLYSADKISMLGLNKTSWVYALKFFIVCFTFGSRFQECDGQHFNGIVFRTISGVYHECYDAIINMGATRLLILSVDQPSHQVGILLATKEAITKDNIDSAFSGTSCELESMHPGYGADLLNLEKTTFAIAEYGEDGCAECLFNYCVMYWMFPRLKELSIDLETSPKECSMVCIKFCANRPIRICTSESFPVRPLTFSNYLSLSDPEYKSLEQVAQEYNVFKAKCKEWKDAVRWTDLVKMLSSRTYPQ